MIAEELQLLLTNAAGLLQQVSETLLGRDAISAQQADILSEMETELRRAADKIDKAAIILHPSRM